jgi:hypothetical protein
VSRLQCYCTAHKGSDTAQSQSEIELEDADILLPQTLDLSLYHVGTKVAKHFDGADGELVWFTGVVQMFDQEEGLYWVLYSDDDSEEMEADEVREAVHNDRVHNSKMLYADAAITAADNSPPDTSAGIDDTPVVVGVNDPAPIVVNSAAPQPVVVHLS